MGLYRLGGRGMVAQLGLEECVFTRLHTFSKALAVSGGACSTYQYKFLMNWYPQRYC